MPMPWSSRQSLFAYTAWSDTTSLLRSSISSLGNGLTTGLRYTVVSPPSSRPPLGYNHSLVIGVDYKAIDNALVSGQESIVTPIRYLPWTVGYQATIARPQSFTSLNFATDFNIPGTVSGGSAEDFQINRGGVKDDSLVDGNYVVFNADFDTTIRLPALLTTMAQGRFVELPEPSVASVEDDWSSPSTRAASTRTSRS